MTTQNCKRRPDDKADASVTLQVCRIPFYFGTTIDPIFGWYHAPVNDGQRRLGMVICPPLGHEYVHAHRSLRHLADHFAVAGIATLRFDYQGTGDSGGVDEDPDRLSAWLNSIRAAIHVLRTDYGCEQVGLAGLRMGGTLAAKIASETDLACLVAWAPCTQGRHYVREMKALQLTGEVSSSNISATNNEIESAGFILTKHTIEDLGKLKLQNILPRSTPILVITRDDLAEDQNLKDAWSGHGLQVEFLKLPGYADMLEMPHNTKVPIEAIRRIVSWTTESVVCPNGPEVNISSPRDLRVEAVISARDYGGDDVVQHDLTIRERIFQFGKGGSHFGILSEPMSQDMTNGPIVLLPNSGSVHHIGANRLYVVLARNLSQAGFRCLRFDLSGIGDSFIDNPDIENHAYPATTSAEIQSAIHSFAQSNPADSFVVMGLCSGAHAAFHAGLDLAGEPIAECLLINPLTFYWKEGMPLDVTPVQRLGEWGRYMKAVRQWDHWKKFLCGDVNHRDIAITLYTKGKIVLAQKIKAFRKRLFRLGHQSVDTNDLEADIHRILGLRRKLAFVFSDTDPGHVFLMACAGKYVKSQMQEGTVTVEIITNANHTFTSRSARREVVARITKHLASRYSDGKYDAAGELYQSGTYG
jgi:alpha-beta hydrolase superfamily lysophospholipase